MAEQRVSWQANLLAFKDEPMALSLLKYDMAKDRQPRRDGHLVSSYLHGSKLHAPVLDLDVPVDLVPSTTSDHHYLEVVVFTSPLWRLRVWFLHVVWKAVLSGRVQR